MGDSLDLWLGVNRLSIWFSSEQQIFPYSASERFHFLPSRLAFLCKVEQTRRFTGEIARGEREATRGRSELYDGCKGFQLTGGSARNCP